MQTEWTCVWCNSPLTPPTDAEVAASGESKTCSCGWSFRWDAEGMHGRSPEAGPHPEEHEPEERDQLDHEDLLSPFAGPFPEEFAR